MPIFNLGLDDFNSTDYEQFVVQLREDAGVLDAENGIVRILHNLQGPIANVQVQIEEHTIDVHLNNDNLYFFGLRVDEGEWISLSRNHQPFLFAEAVRHIGFGESYIAMGNPDLREVPVGCYNLRNASLTLVKFANNGDERLSVEDVKKAVLSLTLAICEGARFHHVHTEICLGYFGSPLLLSNNTATEIKRWESFHANYFLNRADYNGDLRLVMDHR